MDSHRKHLNGSVDLVCSNLSASDLNSEYSGVASTKRSNFGFSVYRGVASMKKEKLWSKEPKTIAQGENKVRD